MTTTRRWNSSSRCSRSLFQKSPAEAYGIMMQVHVNGRGIAGVYPLGSRRNQGRHRDGAGARKPGSRCAPRSKRPERAMFSASLELVLTIAYREAVSRRHAYLTLEHLLYALAHDPDGERILRGVRRRPPSAAPRARAPIWTTSIEQLRRGQERDPEQTAAFRRVLQTAVLHVQSAQRQEVQAGDICAAILQQPDTEAARLLAAQGITRLDILEYISHGMTKAPFVRRPREPAGRGAPAGAGDEGPATVAGSARGLLREPDRARASGPARSADRPHRRTAAHHRSPVPPPQEQPGVRRRAGRRQDRDGRRAGAAAARPTTRRTAEGRRDLRARHRRAARRHPLPRRFRGALQGGHRGARARGRKRFSSSTRCTRPSAPARSRAARWIWRRC